MGESDFENIRNAEINNGKSSHILISLSDIEGISFKANLLGEVHPKILASLMYREKDVIENIRGAIVKECLKKNIRPYLLEATNELEKMIQTPFLQPLQTFGGRE